MGYWEDVFAQNRVVLDYSSNREVHALLHSGSHSDGFIDMEKVVENPRLMDQAVSALFAEFRRSKVYVDSRVHINRVVGPAFGAIMPSYLVARHVSSHRETPCFFGFTEKVIVGGHVNVIFKRSRMLKGEIILLVEDVITTGRSIELTAQAVKDAGGSVLPVVLTLANRSGKNEMHGRQIVSLTNYHFNEWPADLCPLCKTGSKAISP